MGTGRRETQQKSPVLLFHFKQNTTAYLVIKIEFKKFCFEKIL